MSEAESAAQGCAANGVSHGQERGSWTGVLYVECRKSTEKERERLTLKLVVA